jgi:ABC-2 type transport system ATP-binding protein
VATASEGAVLEAAGLTKRFGDRTVVDDVSFHIGRGETYGLLGPNGAGKTTTISMVCGLLPADAGEVHVAGAPMRTGAADAKAAVGLVPQDIALYPDLTARENLTFFGRLQGMRGATLATRVDEVLELIGLTDRAGDRIDEFSGGMKRRCNIGAGLLHRPTLLVLDEPTVGVDPQSRNAILESVQALGGQGLSVLYTTHYMEEAQRLCDRVGIIDEGRLVAEGTQGELTSQIDEHTRLKVLGSGALDAFAEACRTIAGVASVHVADHSVELLVDDGARTLAPVVDAAEAAGVAIESVDVAEPDLEAVFLHLTGKALRD